MSNPSEIVLPVKLDMEVLRKELAKLEGEAKEAGARAATGVGSKATKEAAGGLDKLTESMRNFRREQKQEGATARYFVSEFASFIPVGTKAHDVVMGLTAGLAGGLGLGLAIEGVTIAVKWFADALKAQGEAEKARLEWAKEYRTRLSDLSSELRILNSELSGNEMLVARTRQTEIRIAAEKKLTEAVREHLAAQAALGELTNPDGSVSATGQLAGMPGFGPSGQARTDAARVAAEKVEIARKELEKAELEGTKLVKEVMDRQEAAERESIERRSGAQAKAAQDRLRAQEEEQKRAFESLRNALRLQAELEAQEDVRQQEELSAKADRARAFEALRAAGWDRDLAARLAKLDEAQAAELAEYAAWHEDGLLQAEEYERAKLAITERYAQARQEILHRESEAELALRQMGLDVARSVVGQLGDLYGQALMGSRAYARARSQAEAQVRAELRRTTNSQEEYEAALRQAGIAEKESSAEHRAAVLASVQATLAGISKEAMVKAIFYGAEALAFLAMGKYDSAAEMGAAAAAMGGVAAISGGAAAGIGQGRGMTADERRGVDDLRERARESASASAREGGGSGPGGGGTIREIVIVVGDPFESPQETARRAARRLQLASQLGMLTGR